MAVATFGNNIVGAFTGGVAVNAIYTGSTKVWPPEPGPGYWYIYWYPSNISGTFIDHSSTRYESSIYRLEDYSGYYNGFFDGFIWPHAFEGNRDITSIETNVNELGWGAFKSCTHLSRVSMSKCVDIQAEAFCGCTSLEYVSLPLCTYLSINGSHFRDCTVLSYVYMPECIHMMEHTFLNCTSLKDVYIPKCERIERYCFVNCSSLENIELPVCSYIGRGAFWSCIKLSEVILRSSSVVLLERYSSIDTTFIDTLIGSGQGGIYVPSSLVSAYKAESRWSSLRSVIYPIPS